jgi:CheY-like chemotaxis protein
MTILGHAELAMMRLNPASPARDNLLSIEQAAQRAADLSRQMLAYSGKGKFVVESVCLGDLVSEMTHMLEVSISKKALLRFNMEEDLPPVEVDATQIHQVLMNLVINASEAIGDRSGVIAITTGAMQCESDYLTDIRLDEQLAEGLYVFVEVADTGCGMDRETLSKIFDPFFTTKFTGRGLGMAAVLGIVRGHRGAIKVYSEPGKGTTFKVLLPAGSGHAERVRQAGTPAEPVWRGSGTLLLVDDEETIRALGSEMLEMLGFHVLTACNGREALDVYQAHGEKIRAVVLDLTMPRMDGEEAFRELRRIKPDVRVVMSSGYNEQEVSERFIGKGLAGFVQKPYNLAALGAALRQALET